MARPLERARTIQEEMADVHACLRRSSPEVERALAENVGEASALLLHFTDPADAEQSREGYSVDL